MFVVSFNNHVSFGLPAGVLYTSDVSELSNAFSHLNTIGKTALYDALMVAIEHLGRSPLQRKAILLISDGGDNASRHTLGQVIGMADQSGAVIYTIGAFDETDDDKNPSVLKHLATLTGGQFFTPAKLSDLPGICKKIAQISAANTSLLTRRRIMQPIPRSTKFRFPPMGRDIPNLTSAPARAITETPPSRSRPWTCISAFMDYVTR